MSERPAEIHDVIRIDGQLHTVVQIEWDTKNENVTLEPLAAVLARTLLVEGEPLRLSDALINAGWKAPDA